MSQIKTLMKLGLFAAALALGTTAHAQSRSDAYSLCLQSALIAAGVPAGMQNIANPGSFAGKIFIQAQRDCAQKFGKLEPRKGEEPQVQEAAAPAYYAPVTEEANGAT